MGLLLINIIVTNETTAWNYSKGFSLLLICDINGKGILASLGKYGLSMAHAIRSRICIYGLFWFP